MNNRFANSEAVVVASKPWPETGISRHCGRVQRATA